MFAVESLVGSVSGYLRDKMNRSKKDLLSKKREKVVVEQSGDLPSVQQESDGPPDNEGHDGYIWS